MKESGGEASRNSLTGFLPSSKVYILALGLILLLSLGMRLYGIDWGLPNEKHALSYHIDERNIYYAISNMNPGEFDFNPHYFIYPTFHIYLFFTIMQVTGVQLAPTPASILTGRLMTAFFGVLSIYIVYLIGKEFYGDELGLIASALLAIAPLHVIHSHFLTTDVPVTFWILTSMLFCFKILNSGETKWYILAGITGGLAISTKYNAGLVVLPILTVHILNRWNANRTLSVLFEKKVLLTFILLGSTFVLTSPYILLAFSEFKRDLVLITLYLNTLNAEWFDTGSGWVYHITNSLYYSLGMPLLVFSFFGVGVSLWKRKTQTILIFSFVIPYYLLVGNWQVRFARFVLPLVPLLILFAAFGLSLMWSKSRTIGILVFIGIFLYTSALTISYDRAMASQDPRDQAHDWIEDNIPLGSTIGLPSTFQYFTPPLEANRYALVFTWNASELKEREVAYYIISDLDYRGYLKTKKTREKYLSESAFLDYLFNGTDYQNIKTFQNDQRFLFIELSEEYLPHDMKYANPKIVIFELSK